MTVVETKLSRLKKLIKKQITIKEIEEALANMGMELEDVNEDDLKIEITAERTDLITPEGLARAISSYLGFTKEYQEVKVNKGNYIHNIQPSVKKYRPFTRSFVVKNIKLTNEDIQSIMWIQEKLHETFGRKRKKMALGVYDLDLIKFPIEYTAMKPKDFKFVPLGMNKELNGLQIIQTHPTGKNYADLIKKYDKYPIQIDKKNQILSMPPIINSDSLGKITSKTKNIFIECTGPDEETLDVTMNILATMFYDWKGKIYSVIIKDNKTTICPDFTSRKKTISIDFVNKYIGLDLKPKEAKECAQKMGYDVTDLKKDKLTLTIPSVRTDIWHDVDIADDIARGYGYNNITPTLPNISTIGKMLPINTLKEDLSNLLANLGLIEVKTFALTNKENQYKKMNIKQEPHISLGKNTSDKGINMVRSWLIPECIKALVANRNREYPQRIFEAGIVVIPDEKADVKSRNIEKLVCLLCEEKSNYTNIRQILDVIMDFLDIKYTIKETEHSSFIPGRVASVYVKNKEIAYIGELHPKVLNNFELELPVAALELNLTELFSL